MKASLTKIVQQISSLEIEDFIGVTRPWTADSQAIVTSPEEHHDGFPRVAEDLGYEYFLEVHVALEVLTPFASRALSLAQRVELLLFYAENDAFPPWLAEL